MAKNQTYFYKGGVLHCERDGVVVMSLAGIHSQTDQHNIATRWKDGAGMGEIAQLLEALGVKL